MSGLSFSQHQILPAFRLLISGSENSKGKYVICRLGIHGEQLASGKQENRHTFFNNSYISFKLRNLKINVNTIFCIKKSQCSGTPHSALGQNIPL